MKANIVNRVHKLIALASGIGTPIEEARNAALLAVRLMLEHGLLPKREGKFVKLAKIASCSACGRELPKGVRVMQSESQIFCWGCDKEFFDDLDEED